MNKNRKPTILEKVKVVIQEAGNRQEFFSVIERLYFPSSWQFRMIEKAYNDAKDAFRNTYRDSGIRYFEHLRGATLIMIKHFGVTDAYAIAAMLLHDILEDKKFWPRHRIQAEYNDRVLVYVDCMSMPDIPGLSRTELLHIYHTRLQQITDELRVVIIMKMSDRIHNMIEIYSCTDEKIERKTKETEEIYIPLAQKHCVGWHELLEAVADARASLQKRKQQNRQIGKNKVGHDASKRSLKKPLRLSSRLVKTPRG